jgi:hypothetical protein
MAVMPSRGMQIGRGSAREGVERHLELARREKAAHVLLEALLRRLHLRFDIGILVVEVDAHVRLHLVDRDGERDRRRRRDGPDE